MVATKTNQKENKNISENDILKAQLLNVVLDRSQSDLTNAKVRMENAQLSMVIAQRDINGAESNLKEFADYLQREYGFDMKVDSVDWATGEIRRNPKNSVVEDCKDE